MGARGIWFPSPQLSFSSKVKGEGLGEGPGKGGGVEVGGKKCGYKGEKGGDNW